MVGRVGRVAVKVSIREAARADAPALLALERASPETGPVAIRVEPRVDHFTLAARYRDARGYVALSPDGSTIVGMVFASIAPTQINGELVPGAYLFSLRVHPAHRQRGIGTALVAHAWERARVEFGAQVAWVAVVWGNEASVRACRRAGLTQERKLYARLIVPGFALPRPSPGMACRPGEPDDLAALAAALNARYADHQFWRPRTGEGLAAELTAVHHGPGDVLLCHGPGGALLGAATVFELHRLARLRLLGFRILPGGLNRLLRPLFGLLPVRPRVVRHALLPAQPPEAITTLLRELHRRSLPGAWGLIVMLDPLDPAWPAVAGMPGLSIPFRLLAASERPIETVRPWCFE